MNNVAYGNVHCSTVPPSLPLFKMGPERQQDSLRFLEGLIRFFLKITTRVGYFYRVWGGKRSRRVNKRASQKSTEPGLGDDKVGFVNAKIIMMMMLLMTDVIKVMNHGALTTRLETQAQSSHKVKACYVVRCFMACRVYRKAGFGVASTASHSAAWDYDLSLIHI